VNKTWAKGGKMLRRVEVYKESGFSEKALKRYLVHDSPYFKVLNFNFKAGQELPVHSHEIEGQLCIVVLEGPGEFLGKDDKALAANPGDVLISDISEPHGVKAITDMRVLVTIAPPI
jgi:quercetin dioxygenase-like cupin family protein